MSIQAAQLLGRRLAGGGRSVPRIVRAGSRSDFGDEPAGDFVEQARRPAAEHFEQQVYFFARRRRKLDRQKLSDVPRVW